VGHCARQSNLRAPAANSFLGPQSRGLRRDGGSGRNERYLSAEFPARWSSSLISEPHWPCARRSHRGAEPCVSRHAATTADASDSRHPAWPRKVSARYRAAASPGCAPKCSAQCALWPSLGPRLRAKVGAGLPTAMTIASPDAQFARRGARPVGPPIFVHTPPLNIQASRLGSCEETCSRRSRSL